MDPEFIGEEFAELYEGSEGSLDQSESKLKRRFHKSGILEELGYEEDDIKVEKSDERGKRTDIHCTDEYGNVRLVIEFKKPSVDVGSGKHKSQLVERYMKPLKADFGILYNGLQVIAFSREGSSSKHLFSKRADDLGDKAKQIAKLGQKPDYSLTKIENVKDYFAKFDDQEEKLKLEEASAREHFFENFKLEENSSFESLLLSTIDLFEVMKGENQFLDSAFRFWKESYAKKPEEVPSSWESIMDRSGLSGKEDLYEFMFCLETSYAVFARLIMAKSGEDYEFSDANFSRFIETEVDRASRRGDIAGASWAKVTQELIGDMRDNLVSSVFEEDIFYWWTEPYEDKSYEDLFHVKKIPNETISFGKSLGKITLMIYKFNFSRIDGDPLGVLYQQYFDKETRKALGEFYTPQEVVDYILDSVDYDGRQVLDKRLLDPACGSGTFPVSALQRYLNAAESSGKAEEEGWDQVLDELCNQYRIVGFDIHPFATIMAQIQFMLVLMPYYKKAIEDAKEKGDHFKIQRIPIFRTDSLKDESKGENPTLDQFEGGEKFKMDVTLPVNKEEGSDFFEEEFAMPTPQAAREVGLHNNQEYFGALQAFFDVIKQQADEMEGKDEIADFDREGFEDRLRKYSLTDKDWHRISTLFQSFADNLLTQINRLQTEFDDGRLIKSIEDIYLAALLKNEQEYDYVVGNPPYVRIQFLPDETKEYYKNNYKATKGKFDLYNLFFERGLSWLEDDSGKLSYITSNMFMKRNYGEPLREIISEQSDIEELVNFGVSGVFADATNYPLILTISEGKSEDNIIDCARVSAKSETPQNKIIDLIAEKIGEENYSDKTVDIFEYPQEELGSEAWSLAPERERKLLNKLETRTDSDLEEISRKIARGIETGKDEVYLIDRETIESKNLEEDIIFKALKGARSVNKWRKNWQNLYFIFPYKTVEGELRPVDLSKYSGIESYFKENREKLESRKWYGKTIVETDREWYEVWNPFPSMEEKIVVPEIGKGNNFAYDDGDYASVGKVFSIFVEDDMDPKWVLSQLNSKPLDFFYRQIASVKQGYSYEYLKGNMQRIPIFKDFEKKDEAMELVEKINEFFEIKERIDDFPEFYYEDEEKTKKILKCNSGHPDMEPSIQTTQDGMFEVEVGKRKTDSILLDSKEKAKFVKKALEGDSASKGEEVEILVPRSNSDVKEILQEYEDDKEKLEEMPSVEELEEEINELVYDLYDLDEEEIEVIEDFLEKF